VAELLMHTTNGHRTAAPFPRDSSTLTVQRTYPCFPSPRPTRRARAGPMKSMSLRRRRSGSARPDTSRATSHSSPVRPHSNPCKQPSRSAQATCSAASPSGLSALVGTACRCCPGGSSRPVSPSNHAPFTSLFVSGEAEVKRTSLRLQHLRRLRHFYKLQFHYAAS
jgi:hypothetical protein